MEKEKRTLKKRKGFMLLELIIVVAIIGILAAVAIPNLVGMTDEAKVAKIHSDLSTIGTAMEVYHVKKGGAYPANLSVLEGDNGYLKTVPKPPTGAGDYTIVGDKGKVTCTFNGVTYSSFGTSTGSADSNTRK
uniref:competence type IV pilus major pilin ComGC n=1 Tax=Dialister sp. TaxID=1955814 RepID=UPI004029B11B